MFFTPHQFPSANKSSNFMGSCNKANMHKIYNKNFHKTFRLN